MFAEKQLRTEQEQLMTLTLEMFTVFSKLSNIFLWQNIFVFPRRLHPGSEVVRPGLCAPASAAGRVQAGGQLQRPPSLQAGHGRKLHLL